MGTTESTLSSLPKVKAMFGGIDEKPSATRTQSSEEAEKTAWDKLIDYKLIEWVLNPAQFEDDGVEPPTQMVIEAAIRLARKLRDNECPAPRKIVADANGGIVFERRAGDTIEKIHFWEDGKVEHLLFHDFKLVERFIAD